MIFVIQLLCAIYNSRRPAKCLPSVFDWGSLFRCGRIFFSVGSDDTEAVLYAL